jgi:hypothetical protein
MNKANNHDERIAKMTFASVYPHYVTKVEKKGRTKEELHQVIEWLTGYDEQKLQELMEKKQLLRPSFRKLPYTPMPTLSPG